MSDHRVIDMSAERIEVENVATGERHLFAIMRLGDGAPRTLHQSVEVVGRSTLHRPIGDNFGAAKSFAEDRMAEAGHIDIVNP